MTYWEKYIFEAKEEGKKKRSAADIKREGKKALEELQKENKSKKDKKDKSSSEYTKYLKQQLEFKKQKYEEQKKRQIEKAKQKAGESAEAEKSKAKRALSDIKLQRIGYKDKELSAHSKAIENIGSLALGLTKAAAHGASALGKKKEAEERAKESIAKQKEKKEPGRPGRPRKKVSDDGGRTPQIKAQLPGTPERKKLVPSTKRLPPASKKIAPSGGTPYQAPPSPERGTGMSLGQRARRSPALKSALIKTRMEEYSNWKEEFLFEVEDKTTKKKEKKKIIDIMKGTNKIEMNPRIMEDHKEIESGQKKDDEGYMANVELDQMERAIKSLRKKIKKADIQMPAWVQSKITRAADYIDTAAEYMQSDEKLSEEWIKKKLLLMLILKALDNAKRKKNSQLINGIIGESIDKSKMKCNKPRVQAHGSGETGKSHVVKACEGGKEKLIRFGQLGVKGSPKKEGESEAYASRRHRFQTRHAKNIAKGKMSAAFWANKVKW